MSHDRKKWVRGWWIGFAAAIAWCALILLATALDSAAAAPSQAPAAARRSA